MNNLKTSKILFLLHIPPPVHGSSVVGLSIKESAIINKKFNCNYIDLLASQNVAETGTVNLNKLIGFTVTWVKVLVAIIKKRPDLCYFALTTTGVAFFKDLILVALLRIFRIKCIYHLHNKGISLLQHKPIYNACYKFVFKNAEVILLSDHLYSDISTFVPKSKVHICPNGISDQLKNEVQLDSLFINQTPENIRKYPIENQEKDSNKVNHILFLSNLIESKGVFILLEACALLKKKKIRFKCTFIGGESDISASQLRNKIDQLHLNQQVIYEGKKYGTEKEKAFLIADIFAFPTYYPNECFPLVLLEAMSYSLPVVSTYEGGIQDIVDVDITGILVLQKNVSALADKLEKLINNPEMCRQMGIAGRKKYEHEFTLDIFENRLSKILQQVIEKI